MKNNFFYYDRRQRISILLFAALLVLGVLLVPRFLPTPESPLIPLPSDSIFAMRCDSFRNSLSERTAGYRSYPNSNRPQPILFPFDPNTLDSVGFVRLGLPPFIARNILRYRAKGGEFRKPEHFSKIYGIDSARFSLLSPYINIDTAAWAQLPSSFKADTLAERFPRKFDTLRMVELNRADTALLRRIPGIGTGYAARIVNYRRQLGGYVNVAQLREVEGITDSLYTMFEPWFSVMADSLERIPVNKAGVTRLRKHPYLDFYQAKAIYELRRERKKLKNISELEFFEEFTTADLERLTPYLDFD